MKSGYELLIFDWDGTLADSEALIVQAMQTAIAEQALPARDTTQIRDVIGLGLIEAVQRLYADQPADRLRELVASYQQAWLVATTQPVPLFPGVRETLSALRDAGYLLAVATGKSRRGLDRALCESGLEGVFAATRCADETLSKPDPLMLHELLTELDTAAGSALMIGDTEYDVLMAVQAGVPVLAVTSGVHEPGRLIQSGAIACIGGVADLGAWLAHGRQQIMQSADQ